MARQTGVEHVNQFITDRDGRLAVIQGAPAATVGTVGAALNDEVRCSMYGMASVAVNFTGVTGPTVAFESSTDGGTTWNAVTMWSTAFSSVATTSAGFGQWEGGLPAGTTNFRVRCTVASGAGQTATITPSPAPYRTSQVVNIATGSAVSLNGGGARVGTIGTNAMGAFTDETTTPLAGTGTFTGATRDLMQGASPGSFTSANATPKEFRALAMSDVTGTLYVEVSADQVTYWRAYQQASVAVGSIFVAQLTVLPVTRYARVVYVNGAGGQTSFLLSSARFAA